MLCFSRYKVEKLTSSNKHIHTDHRSEAIYQIISDIKHVVATIITIIKRYAVTD